MYQPPIPPEKCAVLVPVGSYVEPACEAGLAELERRGYKVWRVRGYAAIDQGRNQMATDALAQGFEETLWIDSDIGFAADDVEKLRSHGLPIVCGIYPKKGKRELAVHVLPGTEKIVFGAAGGLAEIKYAATGFLLVRREVYETLERELALPRCNLQFGSPMVPFFQPLIHQDSAGPWYLAEDYAFCERARRCGFRIFADTRIRLTHVGTYAYSWEEAGRDVQRFENFTYHLSAPPPKERAPPREATIVSLPPVEAPLPVWQSPELARLRSEHPWPAERPAVPPRPSEGWLHAGVKAALAANLSPGTRLVVELGSWLGLSTRFIASLAGQAAVIAVDHWRGSAEHRADPRQAELMPVLYETFLTNCWDYRGQILPLRMETTAGLNLLAEFRLRPDLIFLDADHSYLAVRRDFEQVLEQFPEAIVVGDDWDWPSVEQAVKDVAGLRKLGIETDGVAWRYAPQR